MSETKDKEPRTYLANPIDSVLSLWRGCISEKRAELNKLQAELDELLRCRDAIVRNLKESPDNA